MKINVCAPKRNHKLLDKRLARAIKSGYPGCLTQKKFSGKVFVIIALADERYCQPS